MRFRFCGDQDCPDWILAEVSVLSKMSSVRMKLICRQIINQLLGVGINYEKLSKLTHSTRIHFDTDELKAMVAALHFIFLHSAKYDVDPVGVLPMELQQLGMPRDICEAIVKEFAKTKEQIREKLEKNVLALPRLESLDWRVDYLLSSSFLHPTDTNNIRLQLHLQSPTAPEASAQGTESAESAALNSLLSSPVPPQLLSFSLTPAQFSQLYNDLKQAKQILAQV